jgi:hypothetical protein
MSGGKPAIQETKGQRVKRMSSDVLMFFLTPIWIPIACLIIMAYWINDFLMKGKEDAEKR